jgi:hypothetical protein
MNVRKHDVSEWYGHTRRCSDFESAMVVALNNLERTNLVSIWPLGKQWIVISYISALTN